jgi:GT2 family glycosyltransferase/polysaccharide pyruvyl transferase WcaK-like protein/glycosyltransferase involved in cell wall biosynthesis
MRAPSKQIVIAGYFGFGSAGDEAILASLCEVFRGAAQPFRLVAISGNSPENAATYDLPVCDWSDAAVISETVRLSDAVVIAGSSLFDPSAAAVVTTTQPAFLAPAVLSAIHHKPLLLYGISLDGPGVKDMHPALRAVCRAAALITVCDQITFDLLVSFGITASKIAVTADPVWMWAPRAPGRGISLPKPVLGVALANDELPIPEADLQAVLDQHIEATGGSVLFAQLRSCPHRDEAPVTMRLRRSMARHPSTFSVDSTSPESVLDGLAACDAVIADHRQGIVFGLLARKPVLMIGCSPGMLELRNEGLDRMIADGCMVGAGHLLPKLRELCANVGLEETADTAVQRLRDRAKAGATLLLDALEQQTPWDAARCAELVALGLGLGPGAPGADPKIPSGRRLTIGNKELRQKNQRLAAELRRRVREASEANEHGRQCEARVAELESSLAALAERNGALNTVSERLQQVVQEAERLRGDTAFALETYQAQFDAELRLFRSQRAWKVMLYLRKAYTVLVRGTQAGKFPALSGLMSLVFAPSKNLDWYELRFPLLKHAMPSGLQDAFKVPVAELVTTPAIPAPAEAPQRLHRDVPRQQNYDVLILPVFEFDFRFQRPQHLAIQFARAGHRVFWISPSRTASSDRPYEAVPLQPRLYEIRLRAPLPNIYLGQLKPEHVRDALGCLEALYRDFAIAESCSLALLPFWRRLGVALREAFDTKLLYDCMDDWQTMPDLSAFNRSEEPRLAEEADVLVVTGRGLLERHRAAGREPVLVRNGTEFELFSSAQGRGYLEDIPRPIIGYFGAIADWFDYNLLFEVAQSRPHYSFVLIGASGLEEKVLHREAVRLAELPNVYLLGHKPYQEIPAYLAEFDVCIIPFVLNEVTKATDPVKLYEYLSQGKPVVATAMRELEEYRELIYIAATAAEFACSLDTGLAEQGGGVRQRRIDFAANQRWTERQRSMDEAIQKAFPLVSILIVTYNSAEYVQLCLEALLRNTSYPSYEVIVVDNASQDRTAELLEEFAGRDPRLSVTRNDRNLGFSTANNLAAGLARGEYLVLLNIDAVPTPGWMGRLMRHSAKHPEVGLVVPVTNNIGNEAKIRVSYRNLTEMERFAVTLAAEQMGQSFDLTVGPLFCAFLPRAVWDQVGPLDERFKIGMFEDDDFSIRIRKAGLRIVAAEDCFVHHFGAGSFSKLAPAYCQEVFATNKRLFEEKWQTEWVPHKYRPGITAEEGRFRPSDFAENPLAAKSAGD